MALNTRLTQNIDLQADAGSLSKALASIEGALNKIVAKSGTLSQNLEKGATVGSRGWNQQLKQLNVLIGQAQNLQKILDATANKRVGKTLDILDEQSLGKKGAAASRLTRDLTASSTAADVLEKRLALLNKRFAELTVAGRSIGQRDLTKQLKTQEALKQVTQLQNQFERLNSQSVGKNSDQMRGLRTEITKANAELAKMGQNYRNSNFQPQINNIRKLVDEYNNLVRAAVMADRTAPGKALAAQKTAVGILNQSDSQRLASVKRASSGFQFPQGVSETTSQVTAEKALAGSMEKRLRLLGMIQAAQERGAPTRSVDRLNTAYGALTQKMGEQFKLLQQINTEQNAGLGAFASRLAGRIPIAVGITTALFAVVNGLKQATQFVVQYESALKQLQAVSGSTDIQTQRLSRSINEVARSSTYSTLEITKAATVIAQAGFSAQETGKVLRSAITLSTASGSDPSESVDVLTSALGAFQLQATEADHVVDVLVTGLNKSKLSMTQMGQAIQYAGATAKENGVKFEELTAIAASLANAGIRSGSTIGTGLRQLLVDMATPTADFKKELQTVGLTLADVDVKALGFAEVVKRMANAGFTAEAAYSSFETRAASTFLAFKNQVGLYDELALAIAKGGAAAAAEEAAMDSLGSQFQRLLNVLSSVVVQMSGPLLTAFKGLVSLLADVFTAIDDVLAAFGSFGGAIGTIAAGGAIGSIFGPMGALIGVAVGALLGLNDLLQGTSSNLEVLRTKTSDASAAQDAQNATIASLEESINSLIDRQGSLKDGSVALQTETISLGEKFGDLYTYLDSAKGGYDDLLNAMLRYRGEALKQAALSAETTKIAAQQELQGVKGRLEETKGGRNATLNGNTFALAMGVGLSPQLQQQGSKALQSTNSFEIQKAMNATNRLLLTDPNNASAKALVQLLTERLALTKQADNLQQQIVNSDKQIGLAEVRGSKQSQDTYRQTTQVRGNINAGLSQNESEAGTGNDELAKAKTQADNLLKSLRTRMAALKQGTAEYMSVETDIAALESELSRAERASRDAAEEALKRKPTTARKGLNLTSTQVGKELSTAMGAQITSSGPRSFAKQVELYKAYKAGKGPLAAVPGKSKHGSDSAIDMMPIKGKSIDEVVAYLEGIGLEVTEAMSEPHPGGGSHWHFSWKPKTSTYQNKQNSALDSLKKATANAQVGADQAAISRIIAEGKAGSVDPATLQARLKTATGSYMKSSLNKYDTDHPSAGLSGAALAEQQQGREELKRQLEEEAGKFSADLFRSISDAAQKAFDAASKALDTKLQDDNYNAEGGIRKADSDLARAGSRLNKDKIGAGTSYYLQQQKETATLNSDRAKVSNNQSYMVAQGANIDKLEQSAQAMPEGEEQAQALAKVAEARRELNDVMRETAELQQTINDRTDVFVGQPLTERLRNSVAAWADNSGVMKDYQTVLEDNVGPALDMVTDGLTGMFTNLMKGKTSLAGALKGMISSIGDFVTQMIAKALALMAIKWFLSLLGLNLQNTPMGASFAPSTGPVINNVSHSMNGGPAGKPMKLLGGGPTGYISQGVSNRDSVPILGARGEYMLRSAAVKDIGLENVNEMNRHGSKAVSKMAGASIIPSQSKQEMSIYVVKPDERPQLGPRDIVLAITEDMLQGGQTKQLVRRISQGG